jgi:hypothetical protein
MEPIMLVLVLFAAGYAAAIYTWPKLRARINGAEFGAERLKAQVEALLAQVRATAGN